jgi:hypothetical protein
MAVIQIQIGKNFIGDVLIDGGSKINIVIDNLKVQLGLSQPNPMPCNLHMVDKIIAKPFSLIRDLKIFVHGILYNITFIVIEINVLDFSYSMLLRHPWVKDAKVSHDWGTTIITIYRTCIIRTIPIIKKLGVQTKRLKVLVCYEFHFGISNEEEDVIFTTKLDLFSIGIIAIFTNIKLFPKSAFIPYLSLTGSQSTC